MSRINLAATRALDRTTQTHGITITLSRGTNSTPGIAAIVGSTKAETAIDDGGAVIRTPLRDYLIKANLYLINGTAVDPQNGDKITESDGTIFEVRPLGGEPCWRYCDPGRTYLRIHAKQVNSL